MDISQLGQIGQVLQGLGPQQNNPEAILARLAMMGPPPALPGTQPVGVGAALGVQNARQALAPPLPPMTPGEAHTNQTVGQLLNY